MLNPTPAPKSNPNPHAGCCLQSLKSAQSDCPSASSSPGIMQISRAIPFGMQPLNPLSLPYFAVALSAVPIQTQAVAFPASPLSQLV